MDVAKNKENTGDGDQDTTKSDHVPVCDIPAAPTETAPFGAIPHLTGSGKPEVACGVGDKAEPTLKRTQFSTSRLLEFFTEKELTMQIGHPLNLWPLALVRELIDNALDACENAGVAPVVRVVVEPDAVAVHDNGPGLPLNVLERSLDYSVRVSDKSHYVSPTRGQLGNALKCVWAAPFVADGQRGQVEVVTRGEKHIIDVTVDRIGQQPQLKIQRSPATEVVQIDNFVRMRWREIASFLTGAKGHELYNLARFLWAYATFNPHASFELTTPAHNGRSPSTSPDWGKWLPSQPTSSHWYTPERLGTLIMAHIAQESGGDVKPKTVREFVSEFHGLARPPKQKKVVSAAGLSNKWLHDLVVGNNVDAAAIKRLLDSMQLAARPVNPKSLGVIGEPHLTSTLVAGWRCARDSVRYKRVLGEANGLPFVLEVAFGVHEENDEGGREIVAGVNWSPALDCPFDDLVYLLGEMRIDEKDPITLIAHLACPRPEFTDRGKGRLSLPDAIEEALEKCVRLVGKRWKEEKRLADRDGQLRHQQVERMRKAQQRKELTLKEAAYQVMEKAYLHTSGNKADPANARQVMYSARPLVMELTGRCWTKSSYFTQKLLPKFIEANPELTADWNIIFDARGRLIEPHTGKRIDLGTLEVRKYIQEWTSTCPDQPTDVKIEHTCPTLGPANRYRFALFVEKEGFYPLLERYRVADRYDLAIMSTKGMSVTAARKLVDMLSEQGVTVLVLRDFDKSGFSIVQTLRSDSPRYKFRSKPKVIDIGLRLQDVRRWDLLELAEPVDYRNATKHPREILRDAGATDEECRFLVSDRKSGGRWSGRRVEINAFTSPQLIEFLQSKFEELGVTKVVPSGESLERAFRRTWATAWIQQIIDETMAKATVVTTPTVPQSLPSEIAQLIKDKEMSWDEALSKIVHEMRAKKEGRA